MNDVVEIESIAKNFAKTNPVVLKTTPDTQLVFFPEVSPQGIRGQLIRYKKNRNDEFEETPRVDFRKLTLQEGTYIDLSTESLQILCEEVNKRRSISLENGSLSGEKQYLVTELEKDGGFNPQNINEIFKQVLAKNYSREFLVLLENSAPELADKISKGHIQIQRKNIINVLKERLLQDYPESNGNDSWQKWIYENSWLFGVNYKKPIEKQKINLGGIMPDYLFPTVDGFVDILEIKKATFEVLQEDKSHPGSWIWSSESNKAIGQVVCYLNEIDRLRFEIEKKVKDKYGREISMLKPRAYILIGQSKDWSLEQKEGMRKLNHALHGIEIITYTDLVTRGEAFLGEL